MLWKGKMKFLYALHYVLWSLCVLSPSFPRGLTFESGKEETRFVSHSPTLHNQHCKLQYVLRKTIFTFYHSWVSKVLRERDLLRKFINISHTWRFLASTLSLSLSLYQQCPQNLIHKTSHSVGIWIKICGASEIETIKLNAISVKPRFKLDSLFSHYWYTNSARKFLNLLQFSLHTNFHNNNLRNQNFSQSRRSLCSAFENTGNEVKLYNIVAIIIIVRH